MKALSLQQPFALAGVIGVKPWETRPKPTKFRGRHLIHASAGWSKEYIATLPSLQKYITGHDLHFGMIIGSIELADCVSTLEAVKIMASKDVKDGKMSQSDMERAMYLGNFEAGRYAYKWENAEKFATPVASKGALGFWDTSRQRTSYKINTMADTRLEFTYLGEQIMTGCKESDVNVLIGNAVQGYMPDFLSAGIKAIEKRLFNLKS